METIRVGAIRNLVPVIAAVCICSNVDAQTAGSNVVSFGWTHIAPLSSSTPLTITSIGGQPANQELAGTGGKAGSANTAGFSGEHYFTDDIGVALVGGFPIYLNLAGTGSLQHYGVVGKARPWAPQLLLRYHLFSAQSKFRPFVGVGVNYSWFTNARVTNGDFISQTFGPGGSASVKASSSWNPVFEIGANYAFDKHWSAGLAVAYIPASTEITLTGRTAAGLESTTKTKVYLRPIITCLSISYVF